jgi:hypothetical protein
MSRSIIHKVHPIRPVLFLCVLASLLMVAGCAVPALSLPSYEVKRLLALPPSTTGLTPEQSTELRSLLATWESNRQVLDLHLAGETARLKRLMGDGEPKMSPEIAAQASLVYQLRMEQLLETALLREQSQQMLTPEQRIWWARNRLKVVDTR